MVQQDIRTLSHKVSELESQLQTLQNIFAALGLPVGRWVTINEACRIFQRSRDSIVKEIDRAEQTRLVGNPSRFIYGVHYRNDQSVESVQPTWKINVAEYGKYLSIPPEER